MPKPISAFTSTFQQRKQDNSITESVDEFILALRQLITQRKLKWHAPTISHDENDDSIEVSWWKANKSLILTIEPDNQLSFLKVWGPNIYSEMDGGKSPSDDQLIDLWQWLYA